MITLTLFTKAECPNCQQVQQWLADLQDEIPHRVFEVDVAQDEKLLAGYQHKLPVIESGPYRLQYPFDQRQLFIMLSSARDRIEQVEKVGHQKIIARRNRGRHISRADRIMAWVSRHYMLILNIMLFLYVGLPFLAPVLKKADYQRPANAIYWFYSGLCHQFAFRSWFLFGEQPAYPRAAAGVENWQSYGQATGLDEADVLQARQFRGNSQLGFKVAFCERDVAIYGAMLLFGILFVLSGKRIPALPWYLWLLIGWLPIGLDGFSQLLSQPPFSLWAFRESTPLLRTLTGSLFGFTTAWFGFPVVEEGMADTRRLLAAKFQRIAHLEGEQ